MKEGFVLHKMCFLLKVYQKASLTPWNPWWPHTCFTRRWMTLLPWVSILRNTFMFQRRVLVLDNSFMREDHNHMLKHITTCARKGCIPSVGLQYFRDALHDDKTGLTYEALTGKWNQSVPDCEKFFSVGVLKFMEDNKHETEAKVVKTVLNWHKANDGRGLGKSNLLIML